MRQITKLALVALTLSAAWAQTSRKPPQPSSGAANLQGILVDAGCDDRSSLNLRQSPLPAATNSPPAQEKTAESGSVSAKGVTVAGSTLANERADVTPHQTADARSRQMDPTCAVTGATRSFALLMDNGRLLDLDEAGNTLAWQAVLSSSAGHAMLNGAGPGLKPRVTLSGHVHRDRAMVDKILKLE